MELFSVKRYREQSADQTSKQEDEILKKLMQKVEKRKRKQIERPEPKHEEKEQVLKKSKSEAQTPPTAAKQDKSDENKISLTETEDKVTPDDDDIDPTQAAQAGGFEVLGEDVDFAKRQRVDMVLPPWLAHPTIISTVIAPSVADTAEANAEADSAAVADALTDAPYLAPHIRHALKELQVTRLFPVQSAVIPWLLEAHAKPSPFRPRDICVSAPTGSGKTLAFAVPVVQLLATRVQRRIRALVVLPVAELALQVFKVFKKLCEKTDLSVCLLSKQFAFPLEQEKLVECYKGQYHSKVDIVITTPGRLVDHLHSTKGFCLKSLKFLVIDEADRIMDAVFQNWLYHLDEHVRTTSDQLLSGRAAPLCLHELQQSAVAATQPHKLLFSATLSQDPEKLQNLRLFQPKLFTSVSTVGLSEFREKFALASDTMSQNKASGEFIGKYTTPTELTEKYCLTESRLKPLTLYSLIKEQNWTKFICFTNSAEAAGRLAFVLNKLCKGELVINELSAAIGGQGRASILAQFARGKVNGLVCSDALARGIDIPEVDIVISYDPPRHIKTYIHRIGRTARAGRQGTAITLLNQKELTTFNQTLAEVGKLITTEITVSTHSEEEKAQDYSKALKSLREKLEKDKHTKILLKARTKQVAFAHKDASSLTLMEKLQLQTDELMQQTAANVERKTLLSVKKKRSTTFKATKKKFNASAGKTKQIK